MKKTKSKDNLIKIVAEINKNPKKFSDNVDVKELVKILQALSDAYYNTGESLVSDEVYDILKEGLQDRDPTNRFLSEVGFSVKKNKVKLPYPMGSLNKIRPEKENLDQWLEKHKGPYVISDKLDGVSAQYYKDPVSKSYKLYSRGDGIEGQDITHLIRYVIPKTVKSYDMPFGMSVRGEIIMSKDDFKEIAGKMKNARNAVAGVVNSKKVDVEIASLCQFVAYAVLNPVYRQSEQMQILKQYRFKTAHYEVVNKLTFEMLSDKLLDRRKNSEFEIDGIVVVDNSKSYQVAYGNPEHGFAFKTVLDDQIATTKIIKVDWYASKDSFLKPTIEIEPVELGGTTVSHATAFNAKFVNDNKLGPGAIVKIIRSGDVIPYILEVVKPAKEPQMPDVQYKWNETGVDIILKDLYGAQADIVVMKTIAHFFKTLNVEFIGEGTVTKLVDAGYKTIPDIIDAFKNGKDELIKIEGIGSKLTDKIWASMSSVLQNTDLATLMAASNVFGRGFGFRRMKEILREYPDIMTQKWNKSTMKEKIEQIKGFSTITASQFAEHFSEFKKLYNEINKVHDISHMETQETRKIEKTQQTPKTFENKTIVFTGFRDNDLETKIVDRGGRIGSSVSGKTSILVTADTVDGKSSKVLEAEKLNIPIMTKSTFVDKYGLK
jgi:DNA ligase (NAD+)